MRTCSAADHRISVWIRGEAGADAAGRPCSGGGGGRRHAVDDAGRLRGAGARVERAGQRGSSDRNEGAPRRRRPGSPQPGRGAGAPACAIGRTRSKRAAVGAVEAVGRHAAAPEVGGRRTDAQGAHGDVTPVRPFRGESFVTPGKAPSAYPSADPGRQLFVFRCSAGGPGRQNPSLADSAAHGDTARRLSAKELGPRHRTGRAGPRFPDRTGADRHHMTAASTAVEERHRRVHRQCGEHRVVPGADVPHERVLTAGEDVQFQVRQPRRVEAR